MALYLIVGLGNPGAEYARTRHNAGFLVVARLGDLWQAKWSAEPKFKARVATAERGEHRVVLCQPQTYMNASGEAVSRLRAYYPMALSRLLVVVDDEDRDDNHTQNRHEHPQPNRQWRPRGHRT